VYFSYGRLFVAGLHVQNDPRKVPSGEHLEVPRERQEIS